MKWRYHYHSRQRSFLEFEVTLLEVLFLSEPFATGANFLSETVKDVKHKKNLKNILRNRN